MVANAAAQTLPVPLGTASTYGVLAGSAITNTGASIVTGDIGVNPGTVVTGFPPGSVVGGAIHSADESANSAQGALTAAYIDAAGRTPATPVAAQLGGYTFGPGVYNSGTLAIDGTVTLDGQNLANAVFIFQADSTLTTAGTSQVVLINGAQPGNIFWKVGSSATLGTYSVF
jgi:hypothetical protein